MFEDVESTGSETTYRCIKCRNCKVCKEHLTDEIMSVKEEVEQDVINKSVKSRCGYSKNNCFSSTNE